MILFDTSAIYALANTADPNHLAAVGLMRRAADREQLLVHSYIVAEATALLQRRLGLPVASRFLQDCESLFVHWIGRDEHRRAVDLLLQQNRRDLSLVDCVSFAVMRLLGVSTAFAFDADFERAGFRLYTV